MSFYFAGMNRPCIEGATCHQDGVKNFKCECDHGQVCTKDGHASKSGSGSGVRPLVRNLYVKLVRQWYHGCFQKHGPFQKDRIEGRTI